MSVLMIKRVEIDWWPKEVVDGLRKDMLAHGRRKRRNERRREARRKLKEQSK